jgi:cytosine/adenosine deaminase-related metal-dependent hydrolase
MRTRLQGGHVVAYDGAGHELLEGGCVVYDDDQIVFVGFPDDPRCPPTETTIDLPGRLISPGLINLHCIANIDLQPLRIDVGGVGFPRSQAWLADDRHILDDDGFRASARLAVGSLLRCGSTTFCTVTTMASKRFDDPEIEPWLLAEASDELGARAYVAHNFQDHSRYHDAAGSAHVVHDPGRGEAGLRRAVELIDRVRQDRSDRVRGFLFPYTTHSCSDELLRAARDAARDLGVPIRSHFAQYPLEARELLERDGIGPVERMARLDLLGPDVTLTHAIFLRGHPEVGHADGVDEVELLASTGTNVAHCPVVFSRGGTALRSFDRYRRTGVNIGLGTDTVPPDMIGEMRMASTVAKLVEGDATAGSAAAVFDAATLGGAQALGRDDLGRLAPGAKADISVFQLDALHIGVVDCPVKALVHYASSADAEHVIVDGRTVVQDGQLVRASGRRLLAEAAEHWPGYVEGLVARDPRGRSREDLYPTAYPVRHG